MIPLWYALAVPLIIALAAAHAGVDWWLMHQPRPLGRRAAAVLGARWGFIAAVLIFAWLLDSGRVPYSEAGVELLLVIGVGVTAALVALTHRP